MVVANPAGAEPLAIGNDSRSVGYCALIATAAALLGSAVGSLLFLIGEAANQGLGIGGAAPFVLASLLVWLTACTVSLPASLLFGTPLLWLGQRLARDFPLPAAVAFAMIGAVVALGIDQVLSRNTVDETAYRGVSVMFGAVVAATHVLIFHFRSVRSVGRVALVAALTVGIAGAGCRALLDLIENRAAERQYEAECRPGFAVVVLDRAMVPRLQQALASGDAGQLSISRELGQWEDRSRAPLLHVHSTLYVGGVRALALNDVAYAPLTLLTRIGFERPIRRHCMSRLAGPEAELARRFGLVRAPGSAAAPLPLL